MKAEADKQLPGNVSRSTGDLTIVWLLCSDRTKDSIQTLARTARSRQLKVAMSPVERSGRKPAFAATRGSTNDIHALTLAQYLNGAMARELVVRTHHRLTCVSFRASATYLGVLDGRVFPRLGDVAVVPEDGAVVEPKLALLGVLRKTHKTEQYTRLAGSG